MHGKCEGTKKVSKADKAMGRYDYNRKNGLQKLRCHFLNFTGYVSYFLLTGSEVHVSFFSKQKPNTTTNKPSFYILQSEMEALREDIEELNELRRQAKRPRSQSILDTALLKAQVELDALEKAKSSSSQQEQLAAATTTTTTNDEEAAAAVPKPKVSASTAPPPAPLAVPPVKGGFVSITSFGFDAGGYNESFVTLFITLDDVGTVKDNVSVSS
jgi:hypothetical protein